MSRTSRPIVMSLRSFSTSERNDAEIPVPSATSVSGRRRARRMARRDAPRVGFAVVSSGDVIERGSLRRSDGGGHGSPPRAIIVGALGVEATPGGRVATSITVVGLGDSITAGNPGWDPDPVRRLAEDPGDDPESQYLYWAARRDPRLDVRNHGGGGERPDEIRAPFDDAAAGARRALRPGGG